MNIVQLNQYIEKIARCIQIVHSYSSQSPYEYWNAKGDVQYGSVCFCIKKSRMRSNTITYDAVLYYGDRVVDTPSNKEQIWSDANNVIQNIVGTINMQSGGDVSVSYPYDITNFEQKFADNLAGAYATLSIETRGIGECGDLLYGYEEEDKIKLESIVKTITVNGEYDITSSKDYDAISDVKVIVDIPLQEKSIEINSNGHHNVSPDEGYEGLSNVGVIVNVAPDSKDTFASIGYNEENAGGFLNQFKDDLEISKDYLNFWNNGGSSSSQWSSYKFIIKYLPAIDLKKIPAALWTSFREWPLLQVVPSLDFTGKTSMNACFYHCYSLAYIEKIIGTGEVTIMSNLFDGCKNLRFVGLSDMDTSKNKTFHSLFANCESLQSIDVSKWDTRNVTTLYQTFYGCKSLTELDLSKWDTRNVTSVYNCFFYCDKLSSLDISGWDMSNVQNISYLIGTYGDFKVLTDLKFGKNLKTNWKSYGSPRYLPNLTVESLLSIIDGLYDFTSNGETPSSSQGQIELGTTNLNKLTDEQKAVAINKGWTLT